jgi:hypothetical protein
MSQDEVALSQLIDEFSVRAGTDFEKRLAAWPFDFSRKVIHEVVGALLSRQVTLTLNVARNPGVWTEHIAPLILRAMADVHINLAWILKDPGDRAQKYILYGLGQQKLQIERRKLEYEGRDPTEMEKEIVSSLERWSESQRSLFLTSINLGAWSGLPVRKMAEEAGCLDFYDLVYVPFSACVHSTWHHVARFDLEECRNPLHGFHFYPALKELWLDTEYVLLASKYLRKSFAEFDETFGLNISGQTAHDLLVEGLFALQRAADKADKSGDGEVNDRGSERES